MQTHTLLTEKTALQSGDVSGRKWSGGFHLRWSSGSWYPKATRRGGGGVTLPNLPSPRLPPVPFSPSGGTREAGRISPGSGYCELRLLQNQGGNLNMPPEAEDPAKGM